MTLATTVHDHGGRLAALCLLTCGGPPADRVRDGRSAGQYRGERRSQRGARRDSSESASVSVGDVDADGHLDVLLVNGRHWPLENLVLPGKGDGTFHAPSPVGGPADRSYTGALVDVDRDGDLDVVDLKREAETRLARLDAEDRP